MSPDATLDRLRNLTDAQRRALLVYMAIRATVPVSDLMDAYERDMGEALAPLPDYLPAPAGNGSHSYPGPPAEPTPAARKAETAPAATQ